MATRWALMKAEDIGDRGDVLLSRLRVVQTPLFAVYVHVHQRPDKDRELHDHPWSFVSIVLSGGYREVRDGLPLVHRRRWTAAYRRAEDLHRIAAVDPGTWTLLLVGRRRREWGFVVPGEGWVHWETFVDRGRR